MMLMHGFCSNLFGRRTRSLGKGGRRVGARAVEPPLAGMVSRMPARTARRPDQGIVIADSSSDGQDELCRGAKTYVALPLPRQSRDRSFTGESGWLGTPANRYEDALLSGEGAPYNP